jgi:drug/metabolite transporter (DMT)-like permease
MMQLPMRDALLALLVAAIWGMGYVVAKGAMAHFPPIFLMALRYLVAASVLVWFAGPLNGQFPRLLGISVVGATAAYSLTFTGVDGVDAGLGALIVQLEVPFMVLFAALIFGERPGWRQGIGIAIAFVGVALIAGQVRLEGEGRAVFLLIAGAATWALGQVNLRGLRGMSGLSVTAWLAILAAPQLFIVSALFETGQWQAAATAGPMTWAAVFYLGLAMSCLGYLIWNSLILRHEVGSVAPFVLMLPLFSVVGGIVFLGERPDWGQLVGGLIVLAGVALITLRPRAPA